MDGDRSGLYGQDVYEVERKVQTQKRKVQILEKAQPEVAEVLRCRRLDVVDEQGNVRASLDVEEDTPVLSLFDSKGEPRACQGFRGIVAAKGGPEL